MLILSHEEHKINVSYTSFVASAKYIADGEKSSNSAAFSLARATTFSGKLANSAT